MAAGSRNDTRSLLPAPRSRYDHDRHHDARRTGAGSWQLGAGTTPAPCFPLPAPDTPMIVITTHTNADFDSLASMVAARRLYPEGVLVFPGASETLVRRYIESHRASLPPILPLKE